jgi:hypothetical protein
MPSLWRIMAVRWLGGGASEALTGDVVLRDLLMPADPVTTSFQVRRTSEVSHRATTLRHRAEPEPTSASGQVVITERDE